MATTEIIKDTESFAALFEESMALKEMRQGEVITAEVISVESDFVIVNAGLKSESVIKTEEFLDDKGTIEVSLGDHVKVAIEKIEDGYGSTILSRVKAKQMQAWIDLEDAMNDGTIVNGYVSTRVKGGLRVTVNGIMAFLPGSLVDIRPVKDTSPFENKECELKIIKIDRKRNNVVVSRKAVIEEQTGTNLESVIETLIEGSTVKGIVKNITDYGAFVDLGGIDGLLHITDLAWKRIKHPSEILNIGDEIDARVLKFDKEKNRVSLGLKQLDDDPWVGLNKRYPVNTKLFGKVSNLTDYGAFIEIETGIEGLVHVSEMDWTNKNIHPSKAVQLGDEVEIMILEIDEDRRRLSLGMKQCKPNPWEDFAEKNKKDEKITGEIKSITDFGIFIGLEGGIDGLIHLSDISWTETSEEAVKKYKKGDTVDSLIIAIDVPKERISLGVKQLTEDPNPSSNAEEEKKSESKPKEEKKSESKPKTSAKKKVPSKDIENAGTTNLGALLKAKLDDGK
jgi:small subunit ribosomal protein S1|tara:strand:+ start:2915 stop:4438 length:1524 start_codon:yes stop_codon:yes gene_type:complete